MAAPLTLGTQSKIRVETIGRERQPLLIIDDFLANPEAVRDIAAQSPFAQHGPHYPGIRAPVPRGACDVLIDPLRPLLVQTFNLPCPPEYHECYLSLVTTSPQDLQPIQRLPHFDGLQPDRLALLLYLDHSERGGTAFYRQRSTGFETVDAGRYAAFKNGLKGDTAHHGIPPSDYIRGDTEIYEQVSTVSGLFNRAVVYHGNSLHCANLPADFVAISDPLAGRLTLNLFLHASR
jgi:hypothetical protein